MSERTLLQVIPSIATSDGAGVKLRRSLGAARGLYHDPFLMLDEFGTDRAEDYIAGFPPHPHRGFETVTYMLDGHMRHEDHMGNVGELTEGGVQWMTAGRGVIHSEMPQQEEGRMRGFQLWINLPSAEKMKPAAYRDIPADAIPVVERSGATVKVIAGSLQSGDTTISGPIQGLTTEPVFYDVILGDGEHFDAELPTDHNAFVYTYEGRIRIGDSPGSELKPRAAGILSTGSRLSLHAVEGAARCIVLAGKPLHEPVVQHGPFVMNTREEIEQAISDYRDGTLTAA